MEPPWFRFSQLEPYHGLDPSTASLHGFASIEVVDVVDIVVVGELVDDNANFFNGGDPHVLQFINLATVCSRRARGHM